jgi:quinoprotein glucose dehydrogenase
MVPSSTGGANWPGGSLDPETNILYIYSFRQPSVIGMINDPARSDMNFVNGQARDPNAPPPAPAAAAPAPAGEGGGPQLTVQGLPLLKPPYGSITATDLDTGDIVWRIAHGETPDAVRNHPLLKGLTIPRTGRAAGRIGTLVTKTLVIAGEPGFFTMPNGQRGAMLRAYDKATGAEVGAVPMPAPQTGSPMTYMLNGRQYLAVPIAGAGYSGELLVFRAPGPATTTSSR